MEGCRTVLHRLPRKPDSKNPRKTIIGVLHDSKERAGAVSEDILALRPAKVGLELPGNYRKRETAGWKTEFFGDIADAMHSEGIEVVPLENRHLLNLVGAFSCAGMMAEGRLSPIMLIQRMLEICNMIETTHPSMSAERITRIRILLDSFEKYRLALDVYKKCDPQAIREIIKQVDAEREAHMLKGITETQPDVVVVGDAHAERLHGMLDDYAYMRNI